MIRPATKMATSRICSIDGCGKKLKARGWCSRHWERWMKHGDPNAGYDYGFAKKFYHEVVLPYEGDECLMWPFSRNIKGYGQLTSEKRTSIVSRLLCEDVNGLAPTPEYDAAHSCGRGHLGCVAKAHISWKTRVENQADRLIHGTVVRGSDHPRSKLTEHDVHAIRKMKGMMFHREIAAIFGVERKTIGDILGGKRWGWME